MTIRLDTANPLANFSQEGTQPFTSAPGALALLDQSVSDLVNFFGADPDAAPGAELDLFAAFQVSTSTPNNADSGVRLVINDGQSKAVIAACVTVGGATGIALASGVNFSDPANYPVFVPVNWTSPTTLRLRRTAAGDAEIMEVNGVAPNPRAILLAAQLPPRNRANPTVEFGCAGVEALVNVTFSQLFSEKTAAAAPGKLTFTQLRIRDSDSADRLRFRGDYTFPAGATAAIDPTTEPVTLKLTTPAGGQFYPAPDFNPISGFDVKGTAGRRRWSLLAAEKTRTGLERFDLDEDPAGAGAVFLRDTGVTAVAGTDFTTVNLELTVGTDKFTGVASMIEKPAGSGQWRLKSEP